ncbi:Cullin N-terminal, partial [Trinorchestia longiramus]
MALLKVGEKSTVTFEEKWPSMRPTVLRLLRQEPVTRAQWHDLFWTVHKVCLWDEKGAARIRTALQDDILSFITGVQA